MAKLSCANGFTLLEMVLVMLVVSVVGITAVPPSSSGFSLFMTELENRIVAEQVKAYNGQCRRTLSITGHSLITESGTFSFPDGYGCTPFDWHYNASGSISTAGTVSCTGDGTSKDLVFRLGAGRIDAR